MKFFATLFFSAVIIFDGFSNNISVSSVALTGQNTTAGLNNANNFTLVQFNLSWENSHKFNFGPTNWDGAWVFVKYKLAGTSNWEHARLNNIGHTAPVGSSIETGLSAPGTVFNSTTNPGIGAFIYRNTVGTGTFTANTCQFRWNYGANGILDNAVIEVQVYAVEMIYVPTGAFNVGGGGGTSALTSTTINTSLATTAPSGVGSLGGQAGGYPTGQTAPNAAFPNGFGAFYTMKYEISQQQYVDFLNNISTASAIARFANTTGGRNGITVTSGLYSTTNPSVACNNLSWADVAAYLDWSGLRPMTELEFEKATRGTLAAVLGEFAWGSTVVTQASGFINAGLANEAVSNAGANVCASALVAGPLRVGIFAGAATTRVQAGATYYGAMEFSGNLWERAVAVSIPEGKLFTGVHGDGSLSAAGESNVLNWPGTAGTGAAIKGGAYLEGGTGNLGISDRLGLAGSYGVRYNNVGGRGVRTAP